jgi:hypothetical protein
VQTGDELQVRFRVPAGLHVSLFSINGQGRLSLLQAYPPQDNATELAYPSAKQTRSLDPPTGTEGLLVCGRVGTPVTLVELQAVWDGPSEWPPLEPPRRLLRLSAGQVLDEGERPRDLGAVHERSESDVVPQRLDELRERLRQTCSIVEGLAFSHVSASATK